MLADLLTTTLTNVIELGLSRNENIQLSTFKLKRPISLKVLDLENCGLSDISFLFNMLSSKTLILETLNLSWNTQLQLNQLKIKNVFTLKELSLRGCELDDISSLVNLLNEEKLPNLTGLDLSVNQFNLDQLRLNRPIPLKRLELEGCRLKQMTLLSNLINDDLIPDLEELNLSRNPDIKLETFHLSKPINLKHLDVGDCDLTNVSALVHLFNQGTLPYLEELHFYGNENIRLNTLLEVKEPLSLKQLELTGCHLTSISPLAQLYKDGKLPNIEHVDLRWNPKLQMTLMDKTILDSLLKKEMIQLPEVIHV